MVSPSKTGQGTQFGQGASLSRERQFPLRQLPTGRPATGYYWAHTPFSTSILLNWKNSNLSNRENPQKIGDISPSTFATLHPYWALLKIQLAADERQEGINKANKEAHLLHQENPNRTPNPARAIPWQSPPGTQIAGP